MSQIGARGPPRVAVRGPAVAAALWLLLIASTHVAPSQQSRDRHFPAVPPPPATHYAIGPSQGGQNYNGFNLPSQPLAPMGPQQQQQYSQQFGGPTSGRSQHHRSRFSKMSPSRLFNKLKPHGRRGDDTEQPQPPSVLPMARRLEPNDYYNQPKQHGRIASIGLRFRSKIDDVSKRIVHPRSQHSGSQRHDPQGLYQAPYQAASPAFGNNNQQAVRDVPSPNGLVNGQQREGRMQMQPVDLVYEADRPTMGQPRRTLKEDNELRRRAKHEGNKDNPVFNLQARPAPSIVRDSSEEGPSEPRSMLVAPPPLPPAPKAATQPSIETPRRVTYTPTESTLLFKREPSASTNTARPLSAPTEIPPPPTNVEESNQVPKEADAESTVAVIDGRDRAISEAVGDNTEQPGPESTQTVPAPSPITSESVIESNGSPDSVGPELVESDGPATMVANTRPEPSEAFTEDHTDEPRTVADLQVSPGAPHRTDSTEHIDEDALTTAANIDESTLPTPQPPKLATTQPSVETPREVIYTPTESSLSFEQGPSAITDSALPSLPTNGGDANLAPPEADTKAPRIELERAESTTAGLVEGENAKPEAVDDNTERPEQTQTIQELSPIAPKSVTEISKGLPDNIGTESINDDDAAAEVAASIKPEASGASVENQKIEITPLDGSQLSLDATQGTEGTEQTETAALTTMANVDQDIRSPPPPTPVVPEEAQEIHADTQRLDSETHTTAQPQLDLQRTTDDLNPRSYATSSLSAPTSAAHSEVITPDAPSPNIDNVETASIGGNARQTEPVEVKPDGDEINQTEEGSSHTELGTTHANPAPTPTIARTPPLAEINRLPESDGPDQASIENGAANTEVDPPESSEVDAEDRKIVLPAVDDSQVSDDAQHKDGTEQTESEVLTTMASIDEGTILLATRPPPPPVVPEEAHEIDSATQQPNSETHVTGATQPPLAPHRSLPETTDPNLDFPDPPSLAPSHSTTHSEAAPPAPSSDIAAEISPINRDEESTETVAPLNKEANAPEASETRTLEAPPMGEHTTLAPSAVEHTHATTVDINHTDDDELVTPEPTAVPRESHHTDEIESITTNSDPTSADESQSHSEIASGEEEASQIENASQESFTTETPATETPDQIDVLPPSSQEDKPELEEGVTGAHVIDSTESPVGGTTSNSDEEHTTQAQVVDTNDLSEEVQQVETETDEHNQKEEDESASESTTDVPMVSSGKLESLIVSNNIPATQPQQAISPDQRLVENTKGGEEDVTMKMSNLNDEFATTKPEAIVPSEQEGHDATRGSENEATTPADESLPPVFVATTEPLASPAPDEEQQKTDVDDGDDEEMEREEDQQQSPPSSSPKPNELEASENIVNPPMISEEPPTSDSTSEWSREAVEATELPTVESSPTEVEHGDGNSELTAEPSKTDGKRPQEEPRGAPEDSTAPSNLVPRTPVVTTAEPIIEIEKSLVTDSPPQAPSPSPSAGKDEDTSTPKQRTEDSTPADIESSPEPEARSELPIKPEQQLDGTTERPEPDAPSQATSATSLGRLPTLERRVVPAGANDEDGDSKLDIPGATTVPPAAQPGEQEAQTDSNSSSNDLDTSPRPEVESREHRETSELDDEPTASDVTSPSKSSPTTDDEAAETQIDSDIETERESMDSVQPLEQVKPLEHARTATDPTTSPGLAPIPVEVISPATDKIGRDIDERDEETGGTTTPRSEEKAAMTDEANGTSENLSYSTPLASEPQAPTTEEPTEEVELTGVEQKRASNQVNDELAAAENGATGGGGSEQTAPTEEPSAESTEGVTPNQEEEEEDTPLALSTGGQDQMSNSELDNGPEEEEEEPSTETPSPMVPASRVTTASPEVDDVSPGNSPDGKESATNADADQQQEKIGRNPFGDNGPDVGGAHDGELNPNGKDDDDDQDENQPEHLEDENDDLQPESSEDDGEAEEHDDGDEEEESDVIDEDQTISPKNDAVSIAEIDDEPDRIVGVSVNRLTPKEALATDKNQPQKNAKKHKKKKKSKSKSRARSSHRDFMRQPKRRRIFYR